MRLWCTNAAIAENALRKVHLGGRLGDDLALSQRTYDLDTKALASATEDIVADIFAPKNVNRRMEVIKSMAEKVVNAKDMITALQKASKITKAEMTQAQELYNTPDVELLPPGNNMWRLSNAFSLLAQKVEPHRGIELEMIAGELIAA
jgi:hypothetical protein